MNPGADFPMAVTGSECGIAAATGLASGHGRALFAAGACALAIALPTLASGAEPRRVGVFVGSNAAPSGRTPLQHAITDAARLRDVFIDLGAMNAADATLLAAPSAEEILGVLKKLDLSSEDVLVFYYSGHADDRALLLGRTELPMPDLRAALDALPAKLSLHLLDACRSGALTRLKGAKLGKPFSVRADQAGEGRVVITSSAEFEDSQESDRLGGSFFTLHLASGLRGAADADSDGAVTLAEAYRYVYGRTVESTMSTTAGPQHPTFRYDMRGRGDVVLTWPGAGDAAYLGLHTGGEYLIVDDRTGHVIAEVRAASDDSQLSLRPGAYRVQKRTRAATFEGRIDLAAGAHVGADAHLSQRVEHARLVRKGGGPTTAHSLWVEGGLRGPLGEGREAAPYLRASYAIAFPWLTVKPHIGFSENLGADGTRTPRLVYDLREISVGVELTRAYDLSAATLSAGIIADVLVLQQLERQGLEPDRTAIGFVVGATASVTTAPILGLAFGVGAEIDAYSFPATATDREPASDGNLHTELTYRLLASIGYEL